MAINGIEPGTWRIASLILPPRSKLSNKSAPSNKILTRKKYIQFIGFRSCHNHFAHDDYSDVKHTEGDGGEMFQAICKLGREGLKETGRTYRSGLSKTWIKVKNPEASG
jgi:hypothetical protein